MEAEIITQPVTQFGMRLIDILARERELRRILIVSAFAGLRTVLRLKQRLVQLSRDGTNVRLVLGVDLGGTSRQVLEEIGSWPVEAFVLHHPNPRNTFHPKIYFCESARRADLIVGSNNLTEGGLFTNYECAAHLHYILPADADRLAHALDSVRAIVEPRGTTFQRINPALIENLVARGELPTEQEARRNRSRSRIKTNAGAVPESLFQSEAIPGAPPLTPEILEQLRQVERSEEGEAESGAAIASAEAIVQRGELFWRKILPASDALQVGPGTHHVGRVRLTQARFENPPGTRIDQTTYFRDLFGDAAWEVEGDHPFREHAHVDFHVIIGTTDYGVRAFEVSHKPSGEAGQGNYTSILRWGREFGPVIQELNLTGQVLSIYRNTGTSPARFVLEIFDPTEVIAD